MSKEECMEVCEDNFRDSGDEVLELFERNDESSKNKNKLNLPKDKIKAKKSKTSDVIEAGNFAIIPSVEAKKEKIVQRALPQWLSNPIVVNANINEGSVPVSDFEHFLDDDILEVLKENNIDSFFPVQNQLVRELLSNSSRIGCMFGPGCMLPRDICCSAPTGSGKTLAFVIPIVQVLRFRTFPAIRCLVMVPVVELATQVYKIFKLFSASTGVRVGLANGLKPFSVEQSNLVIKKPYGLESRVDVLVCTPGRLVDHLQKTQGFNLTQLRFLVIDEADRMMEKIKQDWFDHVERAVFTPSFEGNSSNHPLYGKNAIQMVLSNRLGNLADQVASRPLSYLAQPPETVNNMQKPRIPLQKLLFSATLSHNPEKLQAFRLYHPKLFTSIPSAKKNDDEEGKDSKGKENKQSINEKALKNTMLGKYVTPDGLQEYFVESSKSERPLILMHMLRKLDYKNVLCFTNSVSTTHRLCALMKLMNINVKEFSSRLHITKRSRIINQFTSGKIDMIISSDAMSRGLDLDNVEYVISYEAPRSIKTYIHRIGRTARAGKTGTAITLIERKEIHHFKKMIEEAGKEKLKETKPEQSKLNEFVEEYQKALALLPETLENEK